ncbi:hypothetical protein COOONC_15287 [Cooperia oncophora]
MSTKNTDVQKIRNAQAHGDRKLWKLIDDLKQFVISLAAHIKTREQVATEMIDWWSTLDEGLRRNLSSRFKSFNSLEYHKRKTDSENE